MFLKPTAKPTPRRMPSPWVVLETPPGISRRSTGLLRASCGSGMARSSSSSSRTGAGPVDHLAGGQARAGGHGVDAAGSPPDPSRARTRAGPSGTRGRTPPAPPRSRAWRRRAGCWCRPPARRCGRWARRRGRTRRWRVGHHRGAAGGVGASVEHHPGAHVDEPPVARRAVLVLHPGRVPVDVPEERLLARVDHLHRAAGVQGEHRHVHLHREVLASPEGPADAGQVQPRQLGRQAQAGGDLALVHVQPLGGDVEVDPAVLGRHGEGRLRPQEGLVLHPDLVLGPHHDLGRGVGIAVAHPHLPQQVAAGVQRRGRPARGRPRRW